MKLYYDGNGIQRRNAGKELPALNRYQLIRPEKYKPDPGLIHAANVALLLGQPLLLTGEAGTGKTQFAYNLAWELGLDEPLKFETKSTSTSRDLFYIYDSFRRFQDAQSKFNTLDDMDILNYIKYQALGQAILYSNESETIRKYVPPNFPDISQKRSVVLIDEVDKASRDFPNDILNEIDLMYFRIPELGNVKIDIDPKMPPIVIITSNSEKDLPDPFLRRCIYYHINFPNHNVLRDIVIQHFGENLIGRSAFLDDAISLFDLVRNTHGIRKKPSIAEILNWIFVLQKEFPDEQNPMKNNLLFVEKTLYSNLLKTEDDQKQASAIFAKWKTTHYK